ncbi:hypothetical protein PR002_g15094 [Phytophthora rubi]|uniref:Uncharacterized protein n=1 Tax=Phytophthora rubi TaxID=129364 RepID=A0A6A3KX42_9STRA|nr:hypothetical protein PR002_g15094 [Phytophthora rubi]
MLRSDTTPSADTMGPARARAVRSLTMESSNDAEVETAVVLDADVDGSSFVESPVNGMDSDMDGDGADSEDWFVETEGVVQPLEDRGGPEDESDVDEVALKKMRIDGWDFDPETQPRHDEAYPGLSTGEYGPTEEM